MIPLKLAWAWTIHKAQGQTMKEKIVLNLGDKELIARLSYVAFSRATKLSNIGINGGCTREKLMEEIAISNKRMEIAKSRMSSPEFVLAYLAMIYLCSCLSTRDLMDLHYEFCN